MVLSVPAQIKDFLDDEHQPQPTDIQEIPQPLSFTGELDSADIEAVVDESLDRPMTGPPGAPRAVKSIHCPAGVPVYRHPHP